MDWILDHLQILVLVAAGIASILTQRKKAADAEEAREHLPPPLPVEDDATRKIREEIARKRAEREGQPAPAAEMPRPFLSDVDESRDQAPGLDEWAQPEPVPAPAPVTPAAAAARAEAARLEDETALLARQVELQERMVALAEARAKVHAEAKAATVAVYATEGASGKEAYRSARPALAHLQGLRDPAEIRRAIIYAEVLGRPKGA